MIRQPETYTPILGKTFVDRLTDRQERPALRIGKDTWSKHEIATRLGIVNTGACAILSGVCKKLGVSSTADLYKQTSPYSLAEHRCGVTTLYAMFAAFRDKGLEIEDWYKQGQKKAIVSFQTLKHRELEAARTTEKAERRRKRGKRPAGGEGTVSRYINNHV